MMITIFAPTELHGRLQAVIDREHRLNELVLVQAAAGASIPLSARSILVADDHIHLPPDWYNLLPPVLYPARIPLGDENLQGLIFARLGNYEKAIDYLNDKTSLLFCTELVRSLQQQQEMDAQLHQGFTRLNNTNTSLALHNLAVCTHYGLWQQLPEFDTVAGYYEQALIAADDPVSAAFTAKHYAILLADSGMNTDAENLLLQWLEKPLPEDARFGLQQVLCTVWQNQLQPPYDENRLNRLKNMLWENLQYMERTGRKADEALLLGDAAQIAGICNSFSEGLGYINKSIQLLQELEQPELAGDALLKKGMLLCAWAQSGQPQFFKGAMDALQAALQVFRRDEAPDIFADIHHHLGIIYSEIPDEIKKKGLWAAVSVSSFNEALNFYNKVDYPYEFAKICHNYGNAFTKYPAALHTDNIDKALAWYREALDIRTAARWPQERCHTLYNFLQAAWQLSGGIDAAVLAEMERCAAELLQLNAGAAVQEEAREHLNRLETLRTAAAGT